ncbi:unnamed protein product [Effrenium voratum]|nr:unnamed protein product [Effrenium voratum]
MSFESTADVSAAAAFGAKSIGIVGSLAVLLNNILGPGIADFSGLYQQTGWLMPSVTTLVCVASSIASGDMLLAAIQSYPGNADFNVRVEYGTLCRFFFPRRVAHFCQGIFQLAMLTANISNIVQTAQVLDYFVASLNHHQSCALMFYPHVAGICTESETDITPFGPGKIVLSVGMILVAVLSIPLGYYNLEDNIMVQNVALVIIIVSICIWVFIFCMLGIEAERVPVVGTSFHDMGGTVLFNFMFISTIPSWICEKKPSVPPLRVIIGTLCIAILGYSLVGVLGGMAFEPYYMTDNTLLSQLNHISDQEAPGVRLTAFASVQAYAISANLASIPIFSILMRYNLIEAKILGKQAAGAASVLVPFGCSVLLYTGEGFKKAVAFCGTFTSAFVNLMVPTLLFMAAMRTTRSVPHCSPYAETPRLPSARECLFARGRPQKLWNAIAWVNLLAMAGLTLIAIVEQFW